MSETRNQFHVFCPSNSSMDLYPNNTISKFRVQINPAIELSGNYEVGLAEIQYPNSWENIRKGYNTILLVYKHVGQNFIHKIVEIDPGFYRSVKELIKTIRHKADENEFRGLKYISISQMQTDANVKISIASTTSKEEKEAEADHNGFQLDSVLFSGDLLRICGFKEKELILSRGENKKGSLQAHVSAGFHSIFVYSDVISEQYVGDSFAPILRILHVEKERSTWGNLVKTYDPIYYIPVRENRINSIEFQLNNDVGENVPFAAYGHVIIVLHFRRIV